MLVMMEGFDNNGTLDDAWSRTYFNLDAGRVNTGTATNGYYSGSMQVANNYSAPIYSLSVSKDALVIGIAVKFSSVAGTSQYPFLGAVTANDQFWLQVINGNLKVYSNGGTFSQTSTQTIVPNTWYYVELKLKPNQSAGLCQVRVNEALWIDFSGPTTGTTAPITQVNLGWNGTGNTNFDDMYILDLTGSTNNDFLGNVRVATLKPSGTGALSQMMGSDNNQVDNYALVNDAGGYDSTYVASSTPNQEDLYTVPAVGAANATVYGVQTTVAAMKTDVGARTLGAVVRAGNVEAVQDVPLGTSTSPIPVKSLPVQNLSPDGDAWNLSDLAGMQIGAKVTG